MKKRSIGILSAIILMLVLSIASTISVSAAKPIKNYSAPAEKNLKAYVDITSMVSSSSITFNYGWDKLGVHAYSFYFENQEGKIIGSTYGYYLGGGTIRYFEGQETINVDNYPCIVDDLVAGSNYCVVMVLYNRNYDIINTFSDSMFLP